MNVWVHEDVPDKMEKLKSLQRRAGIACEYLAAHGRTSTVKGCSDAANRGWKRSPLGGNGGNHFYLWWTRQGERKAPEIPEMESRDIVVRDVRHHDEHEPLDAGEGGKYFKLEHKHDRIEEYIGDPWTSEQIHFIEDNHPVRIVYGQPGSGKTTTLWKAIEARGGQRVLYLTWSRALTETASEHFRSFAPIDTEIIARDFTTFLGEICGRDLVRRTLLESREAFNDEISKLSRELGTWKNRPEALHAELRAALFGAALPWDERSVMDNEPTLLRITSDAYLAARGDDLGKKGAKAALHVADILPETSFSETIFPELAGATEALRKLRSDELPDGFSKFDRVVVDEVQDLTLVEIGVVVEFCRVVARNQGFAPWILVAGDEGQTVRPTGFDWGALKDVLSTRIDTPADIGLRSNMRCPRLIVDVIDRMSQWYTELEKGDRPGKQQAKSEGDAINARLFHVWASHDEKLMSHMEELCDLDGVGIITLDHEPPDWIPERLQGAILSPAEAKGREFQAICVLNPGSFLFRLERNKDQTGDPLVAEEFRTTIDQLRVALSRATETLVFIDIDAELVAVDLSAKLFGEPIPVGFEDLLLHLSDSDTTADEHVESLIRQAIESADERIEWAWERAEQAVNLLGDPELPNGVADTELRERAHMTLLTMSARVTVDGRWSERISQAVWRTAQKNSPGFSPECEVFNSLREYVETDSDVSALHLLEEIHSLGDERNNWIRSALPPIEQRLRKSITEGAEGAAGAALYYWSIEAYLELARFPGDIEKTARDLRIKAVNTLLEENYFLEDAEHIHELIIPEDLLLTGRLREAQKKFEEAADVFLKAGAKEDALRNWRRALQWKSALQVAEDSEKSDIEWLIQFEDLMGNLPQNLKQRLTDEEKEKFDNLAKKLGPGRKGTT